MLCSPSGNWQHPDALGSGTGHIPGQTLTGALACGPKGPHEVGASANLSCLLPPHPQSKASEEVQPAPHLAILHLIWQDVDH